MLDPKKLLDEPGSVSEREIVSTALVTKILPPPPLVVRQCRFLEK